MGIDVTYRRLKKAKWTRLQKDRKQAESFLFTFLPGFDLDSLSDLVSNPAAHKSREADLLTALKRAQNDPTRVDLEKDWHALHFLLSGDPSMEPEHLPDNPLHNVVLGGHPTKFGDNDCPVRCLEVNEVRDIAREVANLSVKDLRRR